MAFSKPRFIPSLPRFPSLPSANMKQWVVTNLYKRRETKQANEATKLKPTALAGASRGFYGQSQLYNAFAPTQTQTQLPPPLPAAASPSTPTHDSTNKGGVIAAAKTERAREEAMRYPTNTYTSVTEPASRATRRRPVSTDQSQWKPCGMCSRRFLRRESKFVDFCSLDCKSAAYLGVTRAPSVSVAQ